ncbi:hypothetical protein CVT24_012421 [Panaeolus cyanescens]|uniref:Uncharacterized protein n=1 Tax=Panaeolus cyanescens TaxID=181874 RepID=A0A409WKB1_9AGAR|nr:hypothetical protein CVT24_012421 [Panaeolus cyanescens]
MNQEYSRTLLQNRDPSKPLDALDGRVAAWMEVNQKLYLITSPNEHFIPLPELGEQEVRMRQDLRYGASDPTLWPQHLMSDQGHLPLIRRKPSSHDALFSILWWDATVEDFVVSERGLVRGLGELSPARMLNVLQLKRRLDEKVSSYLNANPPYSTFSLSVVRAIQTHMHHSVTRLNTLKFTLRDLRLSVTDFQRSYLELEAYILYMTQVRSRSAGWETPATNTFSTVGAYTMDPAAVQRLFIAGVPVWLVREWDGAPVKSNILSIVQPIAPRDLICVADASPPFPTIATSTYSSSQGYHAIIRNSINRCLASNSLLPNTSAPNPSTASSSTSTLHNSSSHSVQRFHPYKDQGKTRAKKSTPDVRNKFLPLDSPYAPYPIPAWEQALKAVNSDLSMFHGHASSGHYNFPDPGMVASPRKIATHLTTWLQIREDWITAINKGITPFKAPEWRVLLGLDLNTPPPHSNTLSGKTRTEVLKKFAVLVSGDPSAEIDLSSISRRLPQWNRTTFAHHELPPAHDIRCILWELYEYNFHYELLALDTRICGNERAVDRTDACGRFELISRCFVRFQAPQIEEKDQGLAEHDEQERLPFLQRLAEVLTAWPGHPPCADHVVQLRPNHLHQYGRERTRLLERELASFYCQQFFNHFGRAAMIPHRIYSPST